MTQTERLRAEAITAEEEHEETIKEQYRRITQDKRGFDKREVRVQMKW